MNVVFIFTSSFFLLWIIRDIFFWLKIWQDNEYRFDRFLEYLKKSRKKQKALHHIPLLAFLKIFLFLSFAYTFLNDSIVVYYQYSIVLLYVIQVFIVVREIYSNNLKKPFLTIKATIILFTSLLTVFLAFSVPLLDKFFWLLLIDLLVSFVVAFFVFLLSFPTELYADIQIEKATKKLRARKNLLVIGVTGSSGKSITKEFIAHVLAKKFRVVKTHGHDNTAIGIARTINEKVHEDTEVFVVEMSAYKRGEIASLCAFISPKISVLTAINNHHLALFKTFENIKRTNFELLTALPKNGICLINGDNKHSRELSQKTKKKSILYKSNPKSSGEISENHITAYNIIHKKKFTSFDVQIKTTTVHCVLHAHHNIEYLLPGMYLAHYLGIGERDIQKAVATFR